MEYLEGQTLADRLVKGPMPISEVLAAASSSPMRWAMRIDSVSPIEI
jgi:hypothetical protein